MVYTGWPKQSITSGLADHNACASEGTTMIRPLMLAALLSSLPTVLMAQSQHDLFGVGRPPSTAAPTLASAAEWQVEPICDGTEVRRLERRRRFGGVLALSTIGGHLLALAVGPRSSGPEGVPRAIKRGHRAMTIVAATMPIAVVGYYVYASSYPGEAFWHRTLAGLKIGETRSEDVRTCLHAPAATSISGTEAKWTYFTTRPDAWWSRGSLGTVSFTFKDGVLTEVRRSEVKLPPGQAWPVTEPMPLVVPVP
jgi:hypothetical protein